MTPAPMSVVGGHQPDLTRVLAAVLTGVLAGMLTVPSTQLSLYIITIVTVGL
jgi:hypothetical protein